MKKIINMFAIMTLILTTGCTQNQTSKKGEEIQFEEDQLYAVAYLGYEDYENLENLPAYIEKYGLEEDLPVHYFSSGEYYLIIPRYEDTDLTLSKNDINTMESTVIYDQKNTGPFIIQCNISDIFPDATICLTYDSKEVEFSPCISLMDGSVQVGQQGKDITIPDTTR